MPFYDHECKACGHIWEDFYSMTKDPPTLCPNCGVDGEVKRLIPDNVSVKVKLGRIEKKEQIAHERKVLKEKYKTDEKFRANMMGEEKYNNNVKAVDEVRDNLKQI